MVRNEKLKLKNCFLPSVVFTLILGTALTVCAADSKSMPAMPGPGSPAKASGDDPLNTSFPKDSVGNPTAPIEFKMLIANPSPKYTQTYPLKAYLPEEIKPEDVLESGGMELVYDEIKKTYYASQSLELKPGESVVKAIRIRDVWIIPEERMSGLSEEAHSLSKKLKGTKYANQSKLLLSNVEVLLTQIVERQNNTSVTTEEHISIFRENKKKIEDIELDLNAMRRFLAEEGGDKASAPPSAEDKTAAGILNRLFGASLESLKEDMQNGSVPAWVLWKVIFAVILFIGMLTLAFVLVWNRQLEMVSKRRQALELKATQPEPEKAMKVGDFFKPVSSSGTDGSKEDKNLAA